MKLIKARAEGKTYAQAAVAAGYSPKHAAQNGYQAVSQIRGRVQDLLDRNGLDENTAIEKYLKPLLEKQSAPSFSKGPTHRSGGARLPRGQIQSAVGQ